MLAKVGRDNEALLSGICQPSSLVRCASGQRFLPYPKEKRNDGQSVIKPRSQLSSPVQQARRGLTRLTRVAY